MSTFVVSPLSNLIEAPDLAPGPFGDANPLIGYKNRITASNISAELAESDFPATNMGNTSTAEFWRSTDTYDQSIEAIFTEAQDTDYLAFARHNFFSAGIDIAVDGAEMLDEYGDPVWTELIASTGLASDGPALVRWDTRELVGIRLRMSGGDDPPEIGVLYCGAVLTLERKIYGGHTPMAYGRSVNAVKPFSISGNYLGSIILGQHRMTEIQQNNITPTWFRDSLKPFLDECHIDGAPYFFAWRPDDYPDEVDFGVIEGDPQPVNNAPSGLMSISWTMRGVA